MGLVFQGRCCNVSVNVTIADSKGAGNKQMVSHLHDNTTLYVSCILSIIHFQHKYYKFTLKMDIDKLANIYTSLIVQV
jgi:hypothetical protein